MAIYIDSVGCDAIGGRASAQSAANFPLTLSYAIDGQAPAGAFQIAAGYNGGNTGYFTIPNPAPKDGRPHDVTIAAPGQPPVTKTVPACTGSEKVTSSFQFAAKAVAVPQVTNPSTVPNQNTATGAALEQALLQSPSGGGVEVTGSSAGAATGLTLAGLAAAGAAAWFFFFRKRG